MYCGDNDDRLPFAWYDNPDPKENNFEALLTTVIRSHANGFDGYGDFESGIFACPTRLKEPLVGATPSRISYGMNAYVSVAFPAPQTRRLAEVHDQAETLLAADIAYAFNHPPIRVLASKQVGYKHSGNANMVFLDGHVSPHAPGQTNDVSLKF